jgi:hypothetical protein
VAFEEEKLEALVMLQGVEQGTMEPEESFELLNKADPTLVYFIFKWIKKHYHRDHEAVDIVRPRLSALCNEHRSLTRRAKSGEDDPVVGWFEGTHRYSELTAEEFIEIIVEKLEG